MLVRSGLWATKLSNQSIKCAIRSSLAWSTRTSTKKYDKVLSRKSKLGVTKIQENESKTKNKLNWRKRFSRLQKICFKNRHINHLKWLSVQVLYKMRTVSFNLVRNICVSYHYLRKKRSSYTRKLKSVFVTSLSNWGHSTWRLNSETFRTTFKRLKLVTGTEEDKKS